MVDFFVSLNVVCAYVDRVRRAAGVRAVHRLCHVRRTYLGSLIS